MIKKPNVFIVGEGTSGTTALYHFLKQHPDVFMCYPKETHYFCKDFHLESDSFHGKQLFYPIRRESEYMALFSGVKDEQIIGEGSATYISSESAAQAIFEFNPESRIIIHLREPVSYLFSYYSALAKRNYETKKSFEEALSAEPRRLSGLDLPRNVIRPSYLYYRNQIKYYDKLLRLFNVFDRNQIWINIFEDFINDNRQVYKKTLGFLDIDDGFEPEFDNKINAFSTPRMPFVNFMLYNRHLRSTAQKLLPTGFYWKFGKAIDRMANRRSQRNPIHETTRTELQNQLRPEVEKVSELTGIDLIAKWGY